MATEKRLIDANAMREDWLENGENEYVYDTNAVLASIDAQPTVDAVPIGVLDQVRWERDVAMQQLEEHGIPFAGIAPDVVKVVRCKDCKHGKLDNLIRCKTVDGETDDDTLYQCFYRWNFSEWNKGDHFCSYGERKDNG